MRLSRFILFSLAVIFLSTLYAPAKAQDEGQDKPYYIVQEGDSLWQVAARFGVAIEDLQEANGLSDAGGDGRHKYEARLLATALTSSVLTRCACLNSSSPLI